MNIREDALKEVMRITVLGRCDIKYHTRVQLIDYVYNGAPLDSFDNETKKDLSGLYEIISHDYFLETNETIPNIFYVEEIR